MMNLRFLFPAILTLSFFSLANGQWVKLEVQTCEGNSPHCIASRAARQPDGSAADVETYLARAYLDILNKKYRSAVDNFTSAINTAPDKITLYTNRSDVYEKLGEGKLAEADRRSVIAIATAAIERDSLDASAYIARGLYYGRLGELDNEMADYNRAIELGAKTAQIYFYRGTSLLKAKELDRALSDLNRAAELGPDYADIYKTRASLYHTIGDLEREQADMQRYAELLKKT